MRMAISSGMTPEQLLRLSKTPAKQETCMYGSPKNPGSRRRNEGQCYSGTDLELAQLQHCTQVKKCPDSSVGKQSTDTFKCLC